MSRGNFYRKGDIFVDIYRLRKSSGKGEGIFATKSFKTGEIVMVGIIEKVLRENHSHASQIGEYEYVFHAGLISKVNHSCNPDCGIKVNSTGAHDFVAIRSIGVNEEITFDYAMRNYGVDYFPKQCMCGSDKCRGKITGWKDLTAEQKKEYEGFVAPYLLALDKKHSCGQVQAYQKNDSKSLTNKNPFTDPKACTNVPGSLPVTRPSRAGSYALEGEKVSLE